MQNTILKLLVSVAVVFSLLSSLGCQQASATNRLGWTQDQQNIWTRMRNENHPYWQKLLSEAAVYNYDDRGMRRGIEFLMTGNVNRASSAWSIVDHWCGRTYRPAEVATHPNWCNEDWNGKPPNNATRDQFLSLSLLYSWIADALPVQDKANFRDILEYWTDRVFNVNAVGHGTRATDSDEQVGHYFGVVLFALAIRDEDPARSDQILSFAGNSNNGINTKPLGGVDATGANYNTQRNTIALFCQKARGGQFIESSEYNLTTARYLLVGAHAINYYYGVDKFPEVTAMYQEFANAFVNEMTPDFRKSFQWGDVEVPDNLKYFNRVPLMSVVSGITKDPRALYLFDRFYNANYPTNTADAWHMLADPYSPKAAPAGQMAHHASGRGLAYYHEGWNANDSFFASFMSNRPRVDHDWASLSNFGLYRNGHWAITNPVGYPGHEDHEPPYMNGLMIAGGVSSLQEATGETAYQSGPGYLYHAGATAGQLFLSGRDNPPLEFVREWNRNTLYINHQDGSDSIVIFDRLNNCDPKDTVNCMPDWRFRNHPDIIENRINAAGSKTAFIVHLLDSNPSINGDTISWLDQGGEQVTLKTFMTNYTTVLYNENAIFGAGAPLYLGGSMPSSQLKYQLRLSSNQKSGYQPFLNVFHVGSPFVAVQLASSSGEQARGALIVNGTESTAAIFNATYNPPPAPSSVNGPPNGFSATHNPQRLALTKALRLFRSGFSMNILATEGLTKVYVMDLDPTKQWQFTIDGASSSPSVSDQGVAIFNLNGIGNHQINISNNGLSNTPPTAVIGNPTINGLTVSFNGSQSSDPEGVALTYLWNFGDGSTSTLMSPTHTYAQANNYTVTLTVSDGVFYSVDTEVITVGSLAAAPILNSIGSKSTPDSSLLTFSVSATDPNGDPIILSAQLSGGLALSTMGASFADNGNGTGVFSWTPSASQIGQHNIIFTASDGSLSDSETITITVTDSNFTLEEHWLEAENPSIPLTSPLQISADAAASQASYITVPNGGGNSGSAPPTTGIASYMVNITQVGDYILWGRVIAPNGTDDSFYVQMDNGTDNLWDVLHVSAWGWDQVMNRDVADPVIFNLSAGTHTIKVKYREDGAKLDKLLLTNNLTTIPNGIGNVAENTLTNHAPTAVINTPIISGLAVNFDASQSTDPDSGTTLTYLWNFGDGQTSTLMSPAHTYARSGTYTVTLSVNDGSLTDMDTMPITVLKPNSAPVAVIAAPVINGLSVNFDGSQSSDPDLDLLTYLWDFGDGQTSTQINPTYLYAQKGNYVVTLTVSDGELTHQATANISLNQAPQAIIVAPVINALTVDFDSSSTDPDGDMLTYLWNFGDGATSNLKNPSHSYAQAGSYTVSLNVSDGSLNDSDSLTLLVESQLTENLWIEAENNSYIISPMRELNDTNASGGQYVAVPNGSGDSWAPNNALASYQINITTPGNYKMWGRVIASTGTDDSFFIRVDNTTVYIWDVGRGGSWHWDDVSDRGIGTITMNLSAGTHKIEVIRREDGTKIDKILLTNDMSLTPTGLGQ